MGVGGRRSTTFKKGDKRASEAGKKSSKALPQELKEARLMHANEFEAKLYKYMNISFADLKKKFKDPNTPCQDLAVIKILKIAIEKGSFQHLDFLLNRTIGKVKDNLELSGEVQVNSVTEMLKNSDASKIIDITPELKAVGESDNE